MHGPDVDANEVQATGHDHETEAVKQAALAGRQFGAERVPW
jgi:hypothetical protein